MKNRAACWVPLFSPRFQLNEVDPKEIQTVLRRCFQRWGLPRAIKVDNGRPLGDMQRSSVPPLALWVIGLGIDMIWNPPRSPRCNAKVERMQATTARWVEVKTCRTYGQLQQKLEQAARLQREHYRPRRLGGKSRRQVYGALWQNTRCYQATSFDVKSVYRYLSKVTFRRKVNKSGFLTFYAQWVYVGTAYKTQTVTIQLNNRKKHFHLCDETGLPLAWFTADNFSAKHIRSLSVCQNRKVKCRNFLSQTSSKT